MTNHLTEELVHWDFADPPEGTDLEDDAEAHTDADLEDDTPTT